MGWFASWLTLTGGLIEGETHAAISLLVAMCFDALYILQQCLWRLLTLQLKTSTLHFSSRPCIV